MTSRSGGRRPWLAILLALLYPGLGHAYLRAWGRAVLWFVLAVGTVVLLVPEPTTDASGVAAVEAMARQVPPEAWLALGSIVGFSMLDVYLLARRRSGTDTAARCPHCGREIDRSLEFCHWCTEPLDPE